MDNQRALFVTSPSPSFLFQPQKTCTGTCHGKGCTWGFYGTHRVKHFHVVLSKRMDAREDNELFDFNANLPVDPLNKNNLPVASNTPSKPSKDIHSNSTAEDESTTSETVCSMCNGQKSISCTNCNAFGFLRVDAETVWRTCPICFARGILVCPACQPPDAILPDPFQNEKP